MRDQVDGPLGEFRRVRIAYWKGNNVVFAFQCETGSSSVDEEFDLSDYLWNEWAHSFDSWLPRPTSVFDPKCSDGYPKHRLSGLTTR
ncbi:hypothetical protein PTKU64_89350 [Paraburkholderia terrae]|uniref:Uncharacterized protein n=1 Tax=Paraburkholderia terrae TaxID=311230 RepID=A0ABN6JXW0_9BURK|nr:hypothetical protein PTKU64_89350 [Paraburkholderia terrae]BDC45557.1 hypothetical protein PTKU15_88540 [Paraburkholderia terrae]